MLPQSCILITGIMAAGKSTIAQQVAERLPKSVHLRGDLFRRMIINGRVEMTSPVSDQAMSQLRLRYQLAALTADRYCAAGFTVVYQDVIIGSILNEVVAMHHSWPLYVVVLCPSPTVRWNAMLSATSRPTRHGHRKGWMLPCATRHPHRPVARHIHHDG